MVLVLLPAFDGLKKDWREAAENLGATPRQYWRHVALPILLPSILGTMILLFGNAFGAHATAYALTGGSAFRWPRCSSASRSPVTFSTIRARLRGGDGNGVDHGALHRHLLGSPAPLREVAGMTISSPDTGSRSPPRPRSRQAPGQAKPVLGMADPDRDRRSISLSRSAPPSTGRCERRRTCSASRPIGGSFADANFWPSFTESVVNAVAAIVLSLLIIVPTAYWVTLRLPKLRPVVEFITLLPFVIPAGGAGLRPDSPLQPVPRFCSPSPTEAPAWFSSVPTPRSRSRTCSARWTTGCEPWTSAH